MTFRASRSRVPEQSPPAPIAIYIRLLRGQLVARLKRGSSASISGLQCDVRLNVARAVTC